MSSPGVVLKTSLREYAAASLPMEMHPPILEGAPVGTRCMDALISLARREVGSEGE